MKPFIFQKWHAWSMQPGRVLLSDEELKKLYQFKDEADAINWLFMNGHKVAARQLNKHCKG